LETRPGPDFAELAVRLAGYGLRTFAEFGLGGKDSAVLGVGLSVEDFVWNVLSEYAEGAVTYEADRGALFSLLARALRNDIIDALRKAAHAREEARAVLPRDRSSENETASLDELPAPGTELDVALDEERYRDRVLAAFAEEPELAEVVKAVLDFNLSKPREIAEALGISVGEYQNRKKRLQRRLIEFNIAEVTAK
jgi:DNA-directed RNA polymerase specialized sigma24 family protein